jgi:hypothetical protein
MASAGAWRDRREFLIWNRNERDSGAGCYPGCDF